MIPGASLASTIKVLAGLGPLGEKVLKQNGISEIDPKKNYPSSIRLKIFEEIRSRFGTDALYTIGIEQGLLMLSMVPAFSEYIDNTRKRYRMRSVSSNNRLRNFNFIDETLPGLQKITNDYTLVYGRDYDVYDLGDNNYSVGNASAWNKLIETSQIIKNKPYWIYFDGINPRI